jgi:hypothetical protein
VCSAYFPRHEVVQIVSFIARGNFLAWVWDMENQQCNSHFLSILLWFCHANWSVNELQWSIL